MLMGEAAFALGFFYETQGSWDSMLISSLPVLAINTGLYILTTLPDISGDSLSNKKTIGALLGIDRGIGVGAVLILAGLAALPWDAEWSYVALLFSLPAVLNMLFRRRLPSAIIALKFTIFGLALSAALYWVWFAALGIAAFAFTKYYFRKRFDTDYPNFSGE
jgi:1,4-dihydroxy-2-naphthoate octaprenyltransferase